MIPFEKGLMSNIYSIHSVEGRGMGDERKSIERIALLYSQEGYLADILKYPECPEITFIFHNTPKSAADVLKLPGSFRKSFHLNWSSIA